MWQNENKVREHERDQEESNTSHTNEGRRTVATEPEHRVKFFI